MLPLGAMVTSWSRLLLKTMSGSVVLPWLGSELMSLAYDATGGHIDAEVVTMLMSEVCAATGAKSF